MHSFEDGRIDHSSLRRYQGQESKLRPPDDVRSEVDAFRGRVISLAYGLERQIGALILWHLFRDRDDGTAGEFKETVLYGGGLGLEKKCA